jgi:hypothetical protein
MLDIVVAHQGEDVRWIDDLPDHCAVTLYTDATDTAPLTVHRPIEVRQLDGLYGTCTTYLHHLMLDEPRSGTRYTVFCNGAPQHLSPAFATLLDTWPDWGEVQPLSWAGVDRQHEADLPDPGALAGLDTRDWIDGLPVEAVRFSPRDLGAIGRFDRATFRIGRRYRQLHDLPDEAHLGEHFLRLCGLHDLAGSARQADLGFQAWGGLFAIRQDRHAQTVQHLRPHLPHILAIVREHPVHVWLWEQLWLHVFGLPFLRLDTLNERASAAESPVPAMAPEVTDPAVLRALASIDATLARTTRATVPTPPVLRVLPRPAAATPSRAGQAVDALRTQDYLRAIALARQGLRDDLTRPTSHLVLALALSALGQHDDVAEHLDVLLPLLSPPAPAESDSPRIARLSS